MPIAILAQHSLLLRVTVFLLILPSLGCSILYKNDHYSKECRDVDWEGLYYDQMMAEDRDSKGRLANMEFVCPYNGVQPDQEARQRAVARLAKKVCDPAAAARWGRDGKENPKVCSSKSQPIFDLNWKVGQREYLIVQLAFLRKDGVFQETVERNMKGRTPLNTNLLDYARFAAEAELDAIKALEIKRMHYKDEAEKEKLIAGLSRRLDLLIRQ